MFRKNREYWVICKGPYKIIRKYEFLTRKRALDFFEILHGEIEVVEIKKIALKGE